MDAETWAFSLSGYAGSKPVLGTIQGDTIRLQIRRYYRNSFAPRYHGRLRCVRDGTAIEGEFRMHPFVRVFMAIWFSFLAFFLVAVLASFVTGRAEVRSSNNLALLLIPLGMAAFGVLLIKFGQWLGRSEERKMLNFLKTTLEAK